MKAGRLSLVALLTVIAIVAGCGGKDDTASSQGPSSTVAGSAMASPSNSPNPTEAYSASEVVESVTVRAGERWTGVTPAMHSALKGVGYELLDCESEDIVRITIDGAEFSNRVDRTAGYIPLTWLGSQGGGNAYTVSAATPVTCSMRLDFVNQSSGEGHVLVYTTGDQQGSGDFTTNVLSDGYFVVLSVNCSMDNANFVVGYDELGTDWISFTASNAGARYYQTIDPSDVITGSHVLNVQAKGCYWRLAIIQ
ncbi:MAG: hypothetical protein PVI21_00190 [Candidatus Woesebacteria bacterium]|jgi:hypothetical protein